MATDEERRSSSVNQDMGNELSQTEAVGGEGKPGHFNKVFADTGYSDLALPVLTDTDKPRDTAGDETKETEVTADETGDQTDVLVNGTVEPPLEQKANGLGNKDYDLIEECEALMKETSKQLLAGKTSVETPKEDILSDDAQSGTDTNSNTEEKDAIPEKTTQVVEGECKESNDTSKDVKDVETTAEYTGVLHVTDTDNRTEEENKESSDISAEASPAKQVSDQSDEKSETETTVAKCKAKKDKKAAKAKEREVIESVQQELKEQEGSSKEKKSGSGFLSMFKFSKRKANPVPDEVSDGTEGQGDNKSNSNAMQNGTIHEAIEDNVNIDLIETDNVGKDKDIEASTVDAKEECTTVNTALDAGSSTENGSAGKPLDSEGGKVVGSEALTDDVEYAVVNKIKKTKTEDLETSTPAKEDNENITGAPGSNEEQYTNGDKTDEDFVYINERPIDIDGLNEMVEEKLRSSMQRKKKDASDSGKEDSEKGSLPRSRKSSTLETASPSRVDQIKKSESGKIKKKSWSFKIGGSRNKSKSVEGFTSDSSGTEGVVSMDPSTSDTVTEPKKSRWRLGKFSFRKSFGDISSSTPNLNEAGQSSEGDGSPAKPAMREDPRKLKKIKAKKEKKRKENPPEKKSASLMNLIFGDNQPRSRRSIVDDDLHIQETDAFDGVTLSDLSHDEDDTVSKNPDGSKGTKTNGQKGKKKKGKQDRAVDKKAEEEPKVEAVDQAAVANVDADIVKEETRVTEAAPQADESPLDSKPSPEDSTPSREDSTEDKNVENQMLLPATAVVSVDDPTGNSESKVIEPEVSAVVAPSTEAVPEMEQDPVQEVMEDNTQKGQNAFSNLIYGDLTDVFDKLEKSKDKEEENSEEKCETEVNTSTMEADKRATSDTEDKEVKRTSRIEIKLTSPKRSVIEDEDAVGTYVTLNEFIDMNTGQDENQGTDVDTGVKTAETKQFELTEVSDESVLTNKPQPSSVDVVEDAVDKQSEGKSDEKDNAVDEEPTEVVVEEEITKSIKKENHSAISFPVPNIDTERSSIKSNETICDVPKDNDTSSDANAPIKEDICVNTDSAETNQIAESVSVTEVVASGIDSVESVPDTVDVPNGVDSTDIVPATVDVSKDNASAENVPETEDIANGIDSAGSVPDTVDVPKCVDSVESATDTADIQNGVDSTECVPNSVDVSNDTACAVSVPDIADIPNGRDNVDSVLDTAYVPNGVDNADSVSKVVVIMKDIGVQAPDIHIPLDIEKEFGSTKPETMSISVGTQATDTAVERSTDSATSPAGSQFSSDAPAFF